MAYLLANSPVGYKGSNNQFSQMNDTWLNKQILYYLSKITFRNNSWRCFKICFSQGDKVCINCDSFYSLWCPVSEWERRGRWFNSVSPMIIRSPFVLCIAPAGYVLTCYGDLFNVSLHIGAFVVFLVYAQMVKLTLFLHTLFFDGTETQQWAICL